MYICTKAIKLNGEAFLPGDPIPAEAIQPGRAGKLIACGCISESAAAPKAPAKTAEEKAVKAQENTREAEEKTEPKEKPKKKKAKESEV